MMKKESNQIKVKFETNEKILGGMNIINTLMAARTPDRLGNFMEKMKAYITSQQFDGAYDKDVVEEVSKIFHGFCILMKNTLYVYGSLMPDPEWAKVMSQFDNNMNACEIIWKHTTARVDALLAPKDKPDDDEEGRTIIITGCNITFNDCKIESRQY